MRWYQQSVPAADAIRVDRRCRPMPSDMPGMQPVKETEALCEAFLMVRWNDGSRGKRSLVRYDLAVVAMTFLDWNIVQIAFDQFKKTLIKLSAGDRFAGDFYE